MDKTSWWGSASNTFYTKQDYRAKVFHFQLSKIARCENIKMMSLRLVGYDEPSNNDLS